jgi:hypothetical protein
MRLLLDTNIFLEVLLGQERAADAQRLLSASEHELFVSDFGLHSIGLLLLRRKQHDVLRHFLKDVLARVGVGMLGLTAGELSSVIEPSQRFGLGFDDAYQYALAERDQLTIVSLDSDFDRTERGRQTPAAILQSSGSQGA